MSVKMPYGLKSALQHDVFSRWPLPTFCESSLRGREQWEGEAWVLFIFLNLVLLSPEPDTQYMLNECLMN